ncbi:MAG: hypothetical protein AMXMBFR84_17960 [Candidatus Hydrogenedentota bacterium]
MAEPAYEPNPIEEIEGWATDSSAKSPENAPRHPSLRAAAVAGIVVWGLLAAEYKGRVPDNVSASEWMGSLLTGSTPAGMGVLTAVFVPTGPESSSAAHLARLNLLNALAVAAAAGFLAAGIAGLLSRMTRRWEALFAGVIGGLAAGLCPTWIYAATAPGPDSLTLLLVTAAWAILFIIRDPQRLPMLAVSGLLLGLSAVNHPGTAWLFVPAIVYALSRPSASNRVFLVAVTMAVAFFLGCAVYPLIQAYNNIPLQLAVLQWSQGPTPLLWGAEPTWVFGPLLLRELSLPVLVLTAAGLLTAASRSLRPAMLLAACIFLMMGPLYPFLTNPVHSPFVPDSNAPTLILLAMTSVSASAALGFLCSKVNTQRLHRSIGPLLLLLVGTATLFFQWRDGIIRRGPAPVTIARSILDSCPENAVLVVGSPRLGSLLVTAQRGHGIREDVSLLAMNAPLDIVSQYQKEQGAEVRPALTPVRFAQDSPEPAPPPADPGHEPDPLLWDVILTHFPDRPVCFAGVSSPWLLRRAQIRGGILVYPRLPDSEPRSFAGDLERVHLDSLANSDPDLAAALCDVLKPLSGAFRHQAEPAKAVEYARIALSMQPDSPDTWRLVALASTRLGKQDDALKYAEQCLRRLPQGNDPAEFLAAMKADDDTRQLELAFQKVIDSRMNETESPPAADDSAVIAALWEAGEFATLARGYTILSALDQKDVDSHYECAAAYAQLGEIQRSRDTLQRAMQLSPETVEKRLLQDDRFVLLTLTPSRAAKNRA